MPTFSATFFDLVIYAVPGFVVLYNIRNLSPFLASLFQAIPTGNGAPTLAALLILAVAFGIVVAGIASLYVPFVSRWVTRIRRLPLPQFKAWIERLESHFPEKEYPKWKRAFNSITSTLDMEWGKDVIILNRLDFARIYRGTQQSVQMFLHHMRIYQSYANMATALTISLVAFPWDTKFSPDPIDQQYFKLVMLTCFSVGTLCAALKSFRILHHVGKRLSEPGNEQAQDA